MVAVPISGSASQTYPSYSQVPAGSASLPAPTAPSKSPELTDFLAAGAIAVGGVLIVTGYRRAGLLAAAAGTALALAEEQEAVTRLWKNLPGYLDDAQDFLNKIEGYVNEATIQGQKLQAILRR